MLLEDIGLLEQYVQELSTFFPLPLCFISPIGVMLEVNPAFEETFGYKFHELIGESLEKIIEKKQADNLISKTTKSGAMKAAEMTLRSKDGREMIMGVYTQARVDENGNLLGFFLGMFDLTDLKKANIALQNLTKALQEERDQLSKLQEAVEGLSIAGRKSLQEVLPGLNKTIGVAVGSHAVAVWTAKKNKEGTTLDILVAQGLTKTYVQHLHEHPLGFDKSTVVGMAAVTRQPVFSSNFNEREERGSLTKELKDFIVREGVRSLASFPLIVQGDLFGILNFYFSQEHNFPPAERRILQLSANMVAIAIGNIESRKDLEDAQKALMNMLEDTDEERERAEQERNRTQLIIQNFSDGLLLIGETGAVELMNPEAEKLLAVSRQEGIEKKANVVFPLLAEILSDSAPLFRKELKLHPPRVVEVTTIPVEMDGGLRRTLMVLHDITREKQIEQMKTEFVSLAAHQLRTPLSAIKWTLKMMLDKDLGPITNDQENFLGKMYESNERMISLINDLLDITRIEEGRYLYQPDFERIEDIIKSVVDSYKEEAKRKNISLALSISSQSLPRVLVDGEKIRLVFQNLVENALHYTPKNGAITVTVTLDKKNNEIETIVQDTGMGIPEEYQNRIFEKFFRADAATKVNTEGSGLGLYLVKNIVEAHGGRVWFDSKIHKGTAFHVTLPVKAERDDITSNV